MSDGIWLDSEILLALSDMPPIFQELNDDMLRDVRAQQRSAEKTDHSQKVVRVDYSVPGSSGFPDVKLRVYRPEGMTGVLPCVYAIHSGGYVLGTYEMEDGRFEEWCPKFGVVGVSVDYRLAPETPYPGPIEDCYAGFLWIREHSGELRIDPARIGIVGASAGGGLAAALALLARDREGPAIAFLILIYPMIDDRQLTTSSTWDVPVWSPAANAYGWKSYLGNRYGGADVPEYAAPARAKELRGLPSTLICVGTADGFCDEDIELARRLNHAGVPVELHVYPGGPHGFDGIVPSASISRRCHRDVNDWLVTQLRR